MQSSMFGADASVEYVLYKALFLVVLAMGLHVSQLHKLTRSPSLTSFAPDLSSKFVAPNPAFFSKNEKEDHKFAPVVVPSWVVSSRFHSLCPITVLQLYMDAIIYSL